MQCAVCSVCCSRRRWLHACYGAAAAAAGRGWSSTSATCRAALVHAGMAMGQQRQQLQPLSTRTALACTSRARGAPTTLAAPPHHHHARFAGRPGPKLRLPLHCRGLHPPRGPHRARRPHGCALRTGARTCVLALVGSRGLSGDGWGSAGRAGVHARRGAVVRCGVRVRVHPTHLLLCAHTYALTRPQAA